MELQKVLNHFRTIFAELQSTEDRRGTYEAYYNAKTTYENLDDQKKTTLAQAEINVQRSESGLTQAQIAREALVQDIYTKHIEGLSFAREDMNQCFAKVKALEAKLDILRSINKHLSEV